MFSKSTILASFIALGVVLGGFSGWFFGSSMTAVGWLGELFLNALKMLIVPLVVSSMVVGVAGLGDIRKMGHTGLATLIYFSITTGISVLIGIVLVVMIQPGIGVDASGLGIPERIHEKGLIGFSDLVLSFVSKNIVQSMAEMDLLPIILFSLLFGGACTTIGEKGQLVIRFFQGVNEVIMILVHMVMYFAPIGIFALVASRLGQAGGGEAFYSEITKVVTYMFTVILALLIHGFLILPLILNFFAKRNPLEYAKNMVQALLTAFSTASSAATLPVTIDCVENRNKVSPQSTLFVCPVGATVNMDGTALYEAVAVVFIAQSLGFPLGITELILIFITATLAGVGAAAIPEAGLVTMVIVLNAVGLPLEGIGLLLAVDWFLDRCRTTVNVWGDSVGAAVIARVEHLKSS